MDKDKALRMALEALEGYVNVVVSVNDPNEWTPKVADAGEPARKAIIAIREVLAQPEQKPVAWMDEYGDVLSASVVDGSGLRNIPLYTAPPHPKPEQEPLEYWNAVEGWVKIDEVREYIEQLGWVKIDEVREYIEQREWVGLTDEEIDEIHGSPMRLEHSGLMGFVRAIEAKLREKNGY